MNKKKAAIFLLIALIAVGVCVWLFHRDNAEYVSAADKEDVRWAYELLSGSLTSAEVMYCDYLEYAQEKNGTGTYTAKTEQDTVIDYKETKTYHVVAETDGWYYIQLEYKPMGSSLSDFSVDIKINGEQAYYEMKTIALPLYWQDETKDFPKDSYGDESAPKQLRMEEWQTTYLYNNTYSSATPLLFPLRAGENEIVLTNVSSDGLGLGALTITEPDLYTPTYAEYRNAHADAPAALADGFYDINAIEYTKKNTTQAILEYENNPALTPHDTKQKVLNTLTWTEAGTEIEYTVKVEKDGWYQLAFHYKNEKKEFDAFETIRIDGEVPFRECYSYLFAPTGTSWTNEVLSDENGKPYYFYLTAGTHTISMKAESEPVIRSWRYARLMSEHVSQFALEITKVTGSEKDKNRTWKMTKYIPEIADYLRAYEILIQEIRYTLQEYTPKGINGALLSDFDKAMQFIDRMSEYPDEIALYTSDLTGRDNSVLVSLSNFTSEICKQDFTLDMIYVYGDAEIPKERAGILAMTGNWFKTLLNSFTTNKYSIETDDDEVLTVWVNRAVTHVDLLQKLADTEFTPKTGIKVKVSIMPDANKLTLSAAADQTPDIALGLTSYMPFDLACRGALYDMTQFEDFWEVANRFVPGAFVPYVYNEGVYAIPETLDFHALVYRTDVFEALDLQVPDTWDDVIGILPELQRYGMNFYHNISSGVGYKWFYQTTPLIFQNGGRLYTDDGLRTAIDEPNSVKGLQALGNLFIAYSLDTQVNSFFNSFRYSILPVGIIDSNEYILLKNGAPELEGQWALSAYPGTVQEDGSVCRYYVANGTGGIIFHDTDKPEDAWTFLKWWTAHDTQVTYTYTLRSTYGKQFFWMPSNVEALADAPIDQKDKEVILEQVQWLRDVPRTPGQYLLERSISDIWNTMVLDGTSAQVAVDEKTIDINREIKKKMKELGYYDDEGNLLKPYVIRDIDWIREQMERAGKEAEE
ncbi:MAG: extracellular solute-binding protein [Lachnospiraceae bacterium]